MADQTTNFDPLDTLRHAIGIISRASYIQKKLEGGTSSIMPYQRPYNPSQRPLIAALEEVERLLYEVDNAFEVWCQILVSYPR